jgi:cell division protein FtsZ
MGINLELPKLTELKPRIVVIGVGGAGGNAINNMIASGLTGVEYIAANTDAQALVTSSAERRIQLGVNLTEGLGAGSKPEIGEAAAEEAIDEIRNQVTGAHMVFIAAGMGGGTGTGAAAVIARAARDMGVLTVGIVTKPFQFEGSRRLRIAEGGIAELKKYVDTLIVIPNQNLFRIATEKTTFADAFVLADKVLYSGVACIVDLIVKDGLINLDFADVRTVMGGMGTAMMGTGQAAGDRRALEAAEEAITNPLLDEVSLKGAKGVLLSIIGGRDMTLYEVDEAASRVRQEVDPEANIIVGATFDEALGDKIRVAIVASGMGGEPQMHHMPPVRARQPDAASATFVPPFSTQSTSPGAATRSGPPRTTPPIPPQLPSGQSRQPATPPPLATDRSETIQRPPEPRELWRAPGDVVIEETRVPRAHIGPNPPHGAPGGAQPPSATADPFRPAAPEEIRRPAARRIPGIEEFPAVGQLEYQQKSARADAASARSPNSSTGGGVQPESQSRGGLLHRMMRGGRKGHSSVGEDAGAEGSGSSGYFSKNRR